MTIKWCNNCKDDVEIEHDSVKGISWCSTCGRQLDINMFISELDFMNNKATGKFVHNGMLRGKPISKTTVFNVYFRAGRYGVERIQAE